MFATTLSKRVGEWIQTVKPVAGLVTSPTPAKVLGEMLVAGENVRRVSILELDAFPSGLYQELVAAAPGVQIVDGTKVFAGARIIDGVERRLMKHADEIASKALDAFDMQLVATAGDAVAATEKATRMQGAEEVYIAIACDLDADRRFARVSGARRLGPRFAIRATVAYKGVWTRRIKTYARDEKDRLAIGRADEWFKTLLRDLGAAVPARNKVIGWTAEGPVGTRPLAVVASGESSVPSTMPAPIVTVALDAGDVPWCGAGLMQGPA
jgi:hypothetical protein